MGAGPRPWSPPAIIIISLGLGAVLPKTPGMSMSGCPFLQRHPWGGCRGAAKQGQRRAALERGHSHMGSVPRALGGPPSSAVAVGVLARIPAPAAPAARVLPRWELGTALGEAPLLHITALTARAPDPVKHHGSASFHPNKTSVMNRGSCPQFLLLAVGSEGILHPLHPCLLPHSAAGLVSQLWDGMLPNPERSPCQAGSGTAAQLQLQGEALQQGQGMSIPPSIPAPRPGLHRVQPGCLGVRGWAKEGPHHPRQTSWGRCRLRPVTLRSRFGYRALVLRYLKLV